VQAAVDLSGRPFLNYDVPLALDRLGALETELVPHFFRSVVDHGKFNLHLLRWAGTNNHHLCEAAFKAFARAFRQAKTVDGVAIPSTKGVL
jgi:imidazoleglycerol-phosphate dehydratase